MEQEKAYLLRMEGVNLENFVYDTNDLATIRGGSLLLLEAPGKVAEHLGKSKSYKVETITSGASWGLLKIEAEEGMTKNLAGEVREFLASDDNYKHATFVVDILPFNEKDDYQQVRNRLQALNRLRQMQSPTVVYPELPSKKKKPNETTCPFDFVSPATEKYGEVSIGKSVKVRRDKGKDKHSWYLNKCGEPNNKNKLPEPAQDFAAIACSSSGLAYGCLDGKMAVIYLDGNKFGEKQSKFCKSIKDQETFDKRLRVELQDETLKTLLLEISKRGEWVNFDKLRLETLIWGGDEILWVVPAWCGWWFLARFYQIVKEKWKLENENLTLGGGLVFCSHKAPIHRVVTLAKNLGDVAKGDRSKNLVALQVLESFDHVGEDFDAFRQQYTPKRMQPSDLVFNGETMMELLNKADSIKNKIPKRQLHRLVSLLYHSQETEEEKGIITQFSELLNEEESKDLEECLGNARWLLLLELWDYLDSSFNNTDNNFINTNGEQDNV